MSNGHFRTFDEFGWTSSLSATAQRAAVQSALDSGENLLAPVAEVVQTDGPLLKDYASILQGNGASTIHCLDTTQDVLQIRGDNSFVSGIVVGGPGTRTGSGIVVGPRVDGNFVIYVTLDRVFTEVTNQYGIKCAKFGGLTIRGGQAAGRIAAIRSENAVVDAGDSKITGVDINADNTVGAGFDFVSGGGWLIHQNKFNQGHAHVRINNSLGNTGTIDLTGNSLEGNTPISVDIVGNSWFNRMNIVGNNFGVLGCAIAVRNYVTSGTAWPWLGGLQIANNLFQAGQNGSNILDIGCAKYPIIGPNVYQGGGAAQCAVYIRPECLGGKVNLTASEITDCLTPWYNYGTGTVGV